MQEKLPRYLATKSPAFRAVDATPSFKTPKARPSRLGSEKGETNPQYLPFPLPDPRTHPPTPLPGTTGKTTPSVLVLQRQILVARTNRRSEASSARLNIAARVLVSSAAKERGHPSPPRAQLLLGFQTLLAPQEAPSACHTTK